MHWEPSEGERLGDRYRLVEHIGDGGFSVVWKAEDERNGEVAIKHPNYSAGKSPQAVEKYFQRELRALNTIKKYGDHPNIMSLHETFTENGTQFMVVEYVDGQELKVRGSLDDPDLVKDAGLQACEIFSYLHDIEIIYRDLKPDNIMITNDGKLILIDFNTARYRPTCGNCDHKIGFENLDRDECPNCGEVLNSETTIKAGIRGQSKYKPQEVMTDQGRQGPWSDVYSIGKLLYFLLAGVVRPIPSDDPRDDGIDCPDYLGDIIVKATNRDPTARYRNAAIMKRALEHEDPDPMLPSAILRNLNTGEELSVEPGDTIGRENASGPYATVEVADPTPENYISRVHAKFDLSTDGWIIVDQSRNGTAIKESSTGPWRPIKSKRDFDGSGADAPPETAVLEDGAKIGIPRKDTGVQFEFRAH